MTPSEFKAWFDGFTEALDGTPSETQWKRIKARVAEIDGRAITEHVYINRYVPQWYYGHPYYYGNYGVSTWQSSQGGPGAVVTGTGTINLNTNTMASGNGLQAAPAFDSHSAMLLLGRAEAQELNS